MAMKIAGHVVYFVAWFFLGYGLVWLLALLLRWVVR